MSDDKVFTPEVVEDNPFPTQGAVVVDNQNQGGTGGNYSPAVTKDRPLPKKRTAVELLSTALNTRSKKVLQEFELAQTGGFKVGEFKEGISGDLRITPNGLTARDQAGITTFAIDGTTGDATFKGTVQSGSVITGSVVSGEIYIGGIGNGNGILYAYDSADNIRFIIDNTGVYAYDVAQSEAFAVDYAQELVRARILYSEFFVVKIGSTTYHAFAEDLAEINTPLLMGIGKSITLRGTTTPTAPDDGGASLYVDQSGGKDRVMVRFNSGASQQIAIEP